MKTSRITVIYRVEITLHDGKIEHYYHANTYENRDEANYTKPILQDHFATALVVADKFFGSRIGWWQTEIRKAENFEVVTPGLEMQPAT